MPLDGDTIVDLVLLIEVAAIRLVGERLADR
jgi:hypothetical protein